MAVSSTKKKPLTVIFDLHGTLIELTPGSKEEPAEELQLRPYCLECLTWAFEHVANVGIWTAGTKAFADSFIQQVQPLLPASFKFALVWSQERCSRPRYFVTDETPTGPRKKLSKLWTSKEWQRHLPVKTTRTNTLIVDDNSYTFSENYGNGVLVSSFTSRQVHETQQILEIFREKAKLDGKIPILIAEYADLADMQLAFLPARLQRHPFWIN
jgi:hypothetical protein